MKVVTLWITCLSGVGFFVVHSAQNSADYPTWESYKIQFNKSYTENEEKLRETIYLKNLLKIKEHNAQYNNGKHTFELGVNQFTDLKLDEFLYMIYSPFRPINEIDDREPGTAAKQTPKQFNWVDEGAVTPVKEQGNCSSGWAFSATGAIEGLWFRSTGNLISLSEQNLIDCSRGFGNNGCAGGNVHNAFKYIYHNKGLNTAKAYPYEMRTKPCRYSAHMPHAHLRNHTPSFTLTEIELKHKLYRRGPISIAIDASQDSFKQYKRGIYHDDNCSRKMVNHAALVVGYAEEGGKEYWLLKNSWGKSWGEQGYMKIARGRNNMCGIASVISYPLLGLP